MQARDDFHRFFLLHHPREAGELGHTFNPYHQGMVAILLQTNDIADLQAEQGA